MSNYEKPVVMVNEELAEGVYAASGAVSTCWSMEWDKKENYDGTWQNFRFQIRHIDTDHAKTGDNIVVVLNFSGQVTEAQSNDVAGVSCSGNTVTITGALSSVTPNTNCTKSFLLQLKSSGSDATQALFYSGGGIYEA